MRALSYPFSCIALCLAINAQAQQVLVITDRQHPVTNVPEQESLRIIELDAPQNLQEQLSVNLPDDPQQAEEAVSKRLTTAGNGFQEMMREALQGIVDAWSLGITRIPAVVVDGHVVYGQPDVGQAINYIQSYRDIEGAMP